MFSFASNIRSINKRFFAPSSGGKAGAMRSFIMGTTMALTLFFTYGAGVCAIFSFNPYRFYQEGQLIAPIEDLPCDECNDASAEW